MSVLSEMPRLRERRLDGSGAARLLVAAEPRWSDPDRDLLLVAGETAEVARTDLSVACALVHHVQAVFLRGLVCAPAPAGLQWALVEPGWSARRADGGWVVRGTAETWCSPPDDDVTYLVVASPEDRLLAVAGDAARGESPRLRTPSVAHGTTAISALDAPAVRLGTLTTEQRHRAVLLGRLLQAAAWYGGIAALGDRMLRVLAEDPPPGETESLQSHCADVDAMLHAAWITLRDAVQAWERGTQTHLMAGYHVARARTLVRLAASAALFASGPQAASRLQLAQWMGSSDTTADASVVAGAALRHGAAW